MKDNSGCMGRIPPWSGTLYQGLEACQDFFPQKVYNFLLQMAQFYSRNLGVFLIFHFGACHKLHTASFSLLIPLQPYVPLRSSIPRGRAVLHCSWDFGPSFHALAPIQRWPHSVTLGVWIWVVFPNSMLSPEPKEGGSLDVVLPSLWNKGQDIIIYPLLWRGYYSVLLTTGSQKFYSGGKTLKFCSLSSPSRTHETCQAPNLNDTSSPFIFISMI